MAIMHHSVDLVQWCQTQKLHFPVRNTPSQNKSCHNIVIVMSSLHLKND